jgi:membrane protein DedA with SNARE-associated domain
MDVSSLIGSFSYLAVFGLLLLCGVGVPLSEDVIILTGGALVSQTGGSLALMIATAWVGELTGDWLLYRIGRSLGRRALDSRRFARVLTPARVGVVERHFKERGAWTIFVARFLPGLRAPTFLISGMTGFPQRKFLFADAAAAAITAPLVTYLGFRFGMAVQKDLRRAGHILLGCVAVAVACWAIRAVRARMLLARVPRP